ncbi:HNH endonuclease [Microbacterium gilvum]
MATLEAAQVLLIAHLVQVACVQYDRELRAARPGEEDRGWAFRSLAEEIAGVLGCSRQTAQAKMGDSVALVNDYPGTLTGMQAGHVSAAQARVILRHGDTLDHDARGVYEERVLARLAEGPMNTARLGAVCEKIAEDVNPETLQERHEAAHARRRVSFQRDRDGMGWLHAYLPALVGEAAIERIRTLAAELATTTGTAAAGEAAPRGAAFGLAPMAATSAAAPEPASIEAVRDERTAAQRQADVLADLLLAGAPTAGPDGIPTGLAGIRASVQITIPAHAFTCATRTRADEEGTATGTRTGEAAGHDVIPGLGDTAWTAAHTENGPHPPPGVHTGTGTRLGTRAPDGAWLCGHGVIPIVQAVGLAARAPVWERLFHDADTGALLTADQRFPTAAQRRYLKARDEHCRFPGCRSPIRTRTSDADHTRDHHHGGPTCICNLAYLCEGHHTLKHHSAWTVHQKPGGILEWTSPVGRTYSDRPAPAIRFTPDTDPPPF